MLFDSLFDYTGPIEIESNVSLEASLQRLEHRINQDGKAGDRLFQSHLRGEVSPEHIYLYRLRPLMGNYLYRPIFVGRVKATNYKVVLKGQFTMLQFTKIFLRVAFIMLALIEALFVTGAVRSHLSVVPTLIAISFIPLVFVLVLGVFLLVKWLNRGDVEWITGAVTASLK